MNRLVQFVLILVIFAPITTAFPQDSTGLQKPEDAPPIRVSSGTMAGLFLKGADPVFPLAAKKAHVSTAAILHVVIGRSGEVETVQVISAPEMTRQAWIDAVRTWVYKPYMLNGKPQRVETTIARSYQMGRPPA